ncbi:MAG: bifunctional hydroxymethylpyrimidine kinase/phosphomethylpyrimidine kinase [Verrucomicrobiales bacterium]
MALTIAGSDSSSGAGLQADLKTFAAHGVYGVNALAATVAEVPGEVARFETTAPTLLSLQLDRVASSFPLSAAKTGMLGSAENVEVASRFAGQHPNVPLVVDPVVFATADARLLSEDGLAAMKSSLIPRALLVTPNRMEAEALLGKSIQTAGDLAAAPHRLYDRYGTNFLVKGGHIADGDTVTDYLWLDRETIGYSHPRLEISDTHGTGCTLSAAIAACLAKGQPLAEAVGHAIDYLAKCLESRFEWSVDGAGIAALNHFPDGVDFTRP